MPSSPSKPHLLAAVSTRRVGFILVAIACLIFLISIPRPVIPSGLPLPVFSAAQLSRYREHQRAAFDDTTESLPYEVRAVGEVLREYGALEANSATQAELTLLRKELRRVTAYAARKQGGRPLLALRALQAELFLSAVQGWNGGAPSQELLELGGLFAAQAKAGRWLELGLKRSGAPGLRSVFQSRWAKVTGLEQAAAFKSSRTEQLLALRFHLRFPVLGGSTTRRDSAQARLRVISAIRRLDSAYPKDFAAGIVLFQIGDYVSALDRFRDHLRSRPDGPWSLRARNFAAASAEALVSD